jgi:hypothetical protein
VHELGRALAELGYENSVSDGRNPYGIVDDTVLQAVGYFRRDHDVDEERGTLPGPVEEHGRWIGPATWQAVEDALAAKERNPAGDAPEQDETPAAERDTEPSVPAVTPGDPLEPAPSEPGPQH